MFLYTLALTLKIVATVFYLRIGLCACYSFLIPRTSHHRISFRQSEHSLISHNVQSKKLVKMIIRHEDTGLF